MGDSKTRTMNQKYPAEVETGAEKIEELTAMEKSAVMEVATELGANIEQSILQCRLWLFTTSDLEVVSYFYINPYIISFQLPVQ